MPDRIQIKYDNKYILVFMDGSAQLPHKIQSILTKVVNLAEKSKRNIIIHRESPVKSFASITDMYFYGVLLGDLRFRGKLALVFPEEMHKELKFFENTARNRGINTTLYSDFNEALKWINSVSV